MDQLVRSVRLAVKCALVQLTVFNASLTIRWSAMENVPTLNLLPPASRYLKVLPPARRLLVLVELLVQLLDL